MNHAKKTLSVLLTGLTVLLATLAVPFYPVSAGIPTGEKILPTAISEKESEALVKLYQLTDEVEVKNITIKIYDKNDALIYSVEGCRNELDCDERINQIINNSDFITEVDNTRIYYLDQ